MKTQIQGAYPRRQNLKVGRPDYRSICENSRVGLFILQEGRLHYINSYFCSLLGCDGPEELIGKSFKDLVFPDDHERYTLEIQELPEDHDLEIPQEHVFRLRRKDGTPVWVRVDSSKTAIDGKVTYFGHANDINKFMEVERAYRASLHRYRKIFEQIEDGLAEVDLKGNITFLNFAAKKILAEAVDLKPGMNYRSYLDEETAQAVYQVYHQVFLTGNPTKFSYPITLRDGRKKFIEDSITLMRDRQGKPTGFRVVTRDIQERKDAEKAIAEQRALLEAIFSSVNDAVITIDSEWKILAANKATEGICGVQVADITGRKFFEGMVHCRQVCREVLEKTLQNGTLIKEYRIECGVDRRRTVNITSSPLYDPQGLFKGAVLVIRDITLLRNLQKELKERHQFQKIIGKSKEMQEIYALIEDLADLETTVLITGESGTGKDMVARALHYSGQRAFKPFVAVNCSALSEGLLESELFGHVKGAFTGALRDKQGRFEAAEGGTLLLDEIGDLSPYIKIKLLRVLQEREYERVGESVARKANVRVVACTHQDLKERVDQGKFRLDLYYRLKVVEIKIPPLRQRVEDLPLLIEHFCRIFNERFHKSIEGVSDEVLRLFMDYPWPGNVRELEHVLEHAFVLCRGPLITREHLPKEMRSSGPEDFRPKYRPRNGKTVELPEIIKALEQTRWNKTNAARLLGISRRTVHRKIRGQNL
jgi:two-component system response regulator HydG